MAQKRPFNEGKRHFKKNKKQKAETTSGGDGSNEDVLLIDVRDLLRKTTLNDARITETRPEIDLVKTLPEQGTEIELSIGELSSTGDGLAGKDGRIYVVPFTTPGDVVVARVYRHAQEERYSLTDLVRVITPSTHRSETPKCRYFGECSGCQFQQLPYEYQLAHKRRVVEKAYQNFSGLNPASAPAVGETVGSPLQYGYRTKLTPHFDGPPGGRRDRRNGQIPVWDHVPPIGFMKKGTRKTMDIEECPIGTESVQRGLVRERGRVAREIDKYQRGATILLRETTTKCASADDRGAETSPELVWEEKGGSLYQKSCITDHNATSTEYIDEYRFDNPAGSFFQNNNSILPLVTKYVRDNILGSARVATNVTVDGTVGDDADASAVDTATATATAPAQPLIKHMIDAYCGSGFFTITLSSMFETSIGIDIAQQSIDYASKNARLNNLPEASTRFLAADANQLFAAIDTQKLPPKETAVVIDPPRKGCDKNFIRQLMEYGPERICYVSCNVHTQARDVGWLVGGLDREDGKGRIEGMYEIESLRGFDFFPQTSHVEGVAILQKKRPGRETRTSSKEAAGEVQ